MNSLLLLALFAIQQVAQAGFYLAADYYLDNKVSSTFKGVCGETIQDDFSWFNSHINVWRTIKYGKDKDCNVRVDSGARSNARIKFYVDWFNVQSSDNCTADRLEIYDGYTMSQVGAPNRTFCGRSWNFTSFPSQRYTVLRWVTDGSGNDKGFRIGALRYEMPFANANTTADKCRKNDPNGEYFYCHSEDICIDPRLQCDGTSQCEAGDDEVGCSGVEKFIGSFLALGTEGNVTWILAMILGIIVIAVTAKLIKRACKKKNAVTAIKA